MGTFPNYSKHPRMKRGTKRMVAGGVLGTGDKLWRPQGRSWPDWRGQENNGVLHH